MIVPKHRETGVDRNRLRRQIRELLRRDVQPLLPSWDLLVRARREAYDATFSELRSELHDWADNVLGR